MATKSRRYARAYVAPLTIGIGDSHTRAGIERKKARQPARAFFVSAPKRTPPE
ncbi:hypothetical protein SALB1_0295 [Salinisphaera sp. LB1]|nr:hypothetical protein SALB1_0295 [Salinisphaera sp. LB1]